MGKNQIAGGNLVYSIESSAQCSVMTERDGMRGGCVCEREVQRKGICEYIQLILLVQQKLTIL